MPKNVTFSLGNIALIDKIDSETNFFESVFGNIGGRSRSFIPTVKLLISNKLNQSVSINKLLDFTPDELLEIFGFEDRISDRSLYWVLERLGDNQPVVLERFQHWIKQHKLVDPTQFVDFSSSYFEGTHCPFWETKKKPSRVHEPNTRWRGHICCLMNNRALLSMNLKKNNTLERFRQFEEIFRGFSWRIQQNLLMVSI